MTIVDSTVWIDFFGPSQSVQAELLARMLPGESLALTDLILCEVLQGVRDDAEFAELARMLAQFTIFNTGGAALSVASAENYRVLRAKGLTVRKTIDCLIATFCIRHGHVLLHRDRDFDPFEKHLGLRVVHP
jgi:predicted nucleic acid-binding protein